MALFEGICLASDAVEHQPQLAFGLAAQEHMGRARLLEMMIEICGVTEECR